MSNVEKAIKAYVKTDITIDWWELGHVFAGSDQEDQGLFLDGAAQGFEKFYKEMQWEYIADWIKENSNDMDKTHIIHMLEGLATRVRGE